MDGMMRRLSVLVCGFLLWADVAQAFQFGDSPPNSGYPTAIDTAITLTNKGGATCVQSLNTAKACADTWNGIQSAIIAIQTSLGTGSFNSTSRTLSALWTFSAGALLGSDDTLAWGNAVGGGTADTILQRGAANILELRNSTNAQESRIYNTYTDASNYEFASMGFINNANVFTIQTEALGTGTVRNFAFMGGNVGIGTAGPNYKLDVVGGNGNQLELDNGGEQYTLLRFSNAGSNKLALYYDNTGGFGKLSTDISAPLRLGVNNGDNLVISTAGNVGIGTATPNEGLEMGATLNIRIPNIKSTTGVRYVCVNTSGTLTSQAAACVGT